MARQLVAVALLAMGCGGARAVDAGRPSGGARPEPAMIDDLERLEAYPVGTEDDFRPVLARENESEKAADRAFRAAARGAWLEAARAFVDAARVIVLSPGTPTWEVAGRNRERLYANADRCFRAAGAQGEARVAFESLAAADPVHRALLLRLRDAR